MIKNIPEAIEKAGVSYMQGYFFGRPELHKEASEKTPAKPTG